MDDKKEKIQKLRDYFERRDDVLMAFLFGSQAENKARSGSDWDIAVYFTPEKKDPLDPKNTNLHGTIEWEEENRDYKEESRVWGDLTDILNIDNVDLIVLNRCPASIADSALRGTPLIIKDRGLYLDFMLLITDVAERYRHFVKDYYAISQRSHSLSEVDAERLGKTIDFLEEEMRLYTYFSDFTQEIYENEILKRHEVEKWLENSLMAVIDIAKIITGSKKQLIPDTYRKSVFKVIQLLSLPDSFTEKFEDWAKLRNDIVHEYLDIKWKKIDSFIHESETYFKKLIEETKKFLTENYDKIS